MSGDGQTSKPLDDQIGASWKSTVLHTALDTLGLIVQWKQWMHPLLTTGTLAKTR